LRRPRSALAGQSVASHGTARHFGEWYGDFAAGRIRTLWRDAQAIGNGRAQVQIHKSMIAPPMGVVKTNAISQLVCVRHRRFGYQKPSLLLPIADHDPGESFNADSFRHAQQVPFDVGESLAVRVRKIPGLYPWRFPGFRHALPRSQPGRPR